MLRLGTLDFAGEAPGPTAVSPALLARALGDLVSERNGSGSMGFAIETLCAALLDDAPEAANDHVDRLIDCGVGVEAIYETYIPRAAVGLGDMWLEDRLSFTGVTIGMARLTEVFRRLGPSFRQARALRPPRRPAGGSALLALTPGETHSLGVVMAADYFQSNGWSVRVELRSDAAGLVRIARAQPFDVIGLSVGGRRMLPGALRLIGAAARRRPARHAIRARRRAGRAR